MQLLSCTVAVRLEVLTFQSLIESTIKARHLDFELVFNMETDDVKLIALDATWKQLYGGSFKSDVSLVVSRPSMKTAALGDMISFCLSHGSINSNGRLLALALKMVTQVANHMGTHQLRPESC